MTKADTILEHLTPMNEGSALAIKFGEIRYADNYIDVMQILLRDFVKEKDLLPIFINVTTPSSLLMKIFDAFEIKSSSIEFIDAISSMMMSSDEVYRNVIYVESPTMLEYIMLKVRFLIMKYSNKKKMVILDSINSLAIHNNYKILVEFMHILVNNLKSENIYTILLSMEEGENKDKINNLISLVCEDFVTLREG